MRAAGRDRGRIAEVLLPVPVSRPYRYFVPDALAPRAVVGARVVVPVRRRRVIGVVLGVDDGTPDRALKPVADAPDAEPALSPALLELGRWISRYYGTPLGLAMRALLPGALWGVRRPAGPAGRVERVVTLAGALPSLLERERAFRRAPKRRAVYEALEALGGSAPLRHLRERLQLPAAAVDGLVRQGLARYERVARQRDPFADLSPPPPVTPTDDQRRIVAQVAALPADTPALIHGVTGSGKTLVYLEVLRRVVDDGRGAILLVPEIALTPQTVARVRGVFGDQVAVLHSGLSDGERADAWRALRSGARRVAVGARSAIFAPVPRLGAIVVDEEHEASYKQGTAPRYHARDAAAVRARLEGARLLLGSATPSLEALHWGETGRLRGIGTQQLEHFLELRFPAARLARMDLDTTSSKWAHHRILERVGRREVDILLGTQMIAKGLDFPNVTVVGVVDADTALHLPDFRAAERTFQLLAQVAGRAGRGPLGGRVVVQTRAPGHHAIRAASHHSVEEFAAAELPLRAPPHPAYPPHVGLARFLAAAAQEPAARRAAERVAAWLRRASAEKLAGALTVLGPAPCPIPRLQNRWRWLVLAKAADPKTLGRVMHAWQT